MTEPPCLRARFAASFGSSSLGSFSLDVELATGKGPLVVIGPNGAGKTRLLSLLLGALPCDRGFIEVCGQVLLDTQHGLSVAVEDRRLGYVPQDYALFPHMSVRENVAFAVRASTRGSKTLLGQRIEAALTNFGLSTLRARKVATLSGGERQRVALARALAIEPRALLLDEPLAALDLPARSQVRGFLAQTLRELALPTIVVSHEPEDARVLGHQIVVLESGRITQRGSWDELVRAPASSFVAAFVAQGARG